MFISNTGNHTVTECCCCKKLMSIENEKEGYSNLDEIYDLYLAHLKRNKQCRTYHDKLPKLADLKGIAPDITEGLSPEAFVRKMRDEW